MYSWILIVVLVTLNDTPLGGCLPLTKSVTSPPKPMQLKTNNLKSKNPNWNATWTDKLKQDLLLNYDKYARPTQHNDTTVVTLELAIRHFELDEQKGVLTVHCWPRMIWVDEKLRWDSSQYNGLKILHLANHEVWQPDILPYNSATGSGIEHYGNINLLVYENGSVLWVPPTIFHLFCTMDFSRWPFDTQNCSIMLGSWTYSGDQVDLIVPEGITEPADFSSMHPNSEWDLVEVMTERSINYFECCFGPSPDLTFYLILKRQSAMYRALVITPASVIILLILATFWLPASSPNEKVTCSIAAIIVNIIIFLFFSDRIPKITSQVPHVVLFYSRCLYMSAFAITIAVFVVNLARNPKKRTVPRFCKKYLSGKFGQFLFIADIINRDSLKGHEMTDTHPVLPEQDTNAQETSPELTRLEWALLALAIDRICFLVYLIAFTILALIYSF